MPQGLLFRAARASRAQADLRTHVATWDLPDVKQAAEGRGCFDHNDNCAFPRPWAGNRSGAGPHLRRVGAMHCGADHAVPWLTRGAAVEWVGKAKRLSCFNPVPIESRMMASIEEGASPGAAAAKHAGFAATCPMGRNKTPEEMAGPVVFLASFYAPRFRVCYARLQPQEQPAG